MSNYDFDITTLKCSSDDGINYLSLNPTVTTDNWITTTISTYDNYCKEYLGAWKEKGEDNMLESYDILNVYKKNKIEKLKDAADKACDAILDSLKKQKELTESINSFKAAVEQLYTSQFAEGQTESNVDNETLEIIKKGDFCSGYVINEGYYSEELAKIDEDLEDAIEEVEKQLEPVRALLKICNDKNEVEEVLKRYSILDKSGKINLE